jgi:hypothetical protein
MLHACKTIDSNLASPPDACLSSGELISTPAPTLTESLNETAISAVPGEGQK